MDLHSRLHEHVDAWSQSFQQETEHIKQRCGYLEQEVSNLKALLADSAIIQEGSQNAQRIKELEKQLAQMNLRSHNLQADTGEE